MENIVDIYNLLSGEINETIRKLTNALEIVKCRKNTNSKFVDKEKIKKLEENEYLKAELEYSKKLRAVVQTRKNQQQNKK